MPITTSAKKALRSSKRKHTFNMKKKDIFTKSVKNLKKLVLEKKTKEAEVLFTKVQQALDKATKTGILKKNTSSRKKSRLSAMIKKAK